MTQPIQETTDQRQISGLDYRTRQLARRPSLAAAAGGSCAVILYDIAFVNAGDENVAANTWETITDGGGNGRYFTEGWQTCDEWQVFNEALGNFQNNTEAFYEAWISVEFGNAANDAYIGAAVQFAASTDYFYDNVTIVKAAGDRVQASAHTAGTLTTAVRFWVWTETQRAIRSCEILARRHEFIDDTMLLEY